MVNRSFFVLLLSFAVVLSHPASQIPEGNVSYAAPEIVSTFNDDMSPDGTLDTRRHEALVNLQQIFGIPELTDRPSPHKILPQFMTELYNTVADSNGVTRGENPYNAKIVRSFIERASSLSHYYLFNVTGLEMDESVLGAELHLHLKRTPLKATHQALLSSSCYVIRLYQVLDDHQLDMPDSHKLIHTERVGDHASGWQVLDAKQAVLSWISGTPNLGLLVTVSDSLGGGAAVRFSRGSELDTKQPILVLFNDDGTETPAHENTVPHHYEYENELEEGSKEDTVDFGDRGTYQEDSSSIEGDAFERQKREATSSKERLQRIASKNGKIAGGLTSMEVYERAWIRRKHFSSGKLASAESLTSDSTSESKIPSRRSRSTPKVFTINAPIAETNGYCARHELDVDFAELGWSDWIIAPPSYLAYQCKGQCDYPLRSDQYTTNHAITQTLVYLLKGGENVNNACCVPTQLLPLTVLYLEKSNQVILKKYLDMVIEKCGCA